MLRAFLLQDRPSCTLRLGRAGTFAVRLWIGLFALLRFTACSLASTQIMNTSFEGVERATPTDSSKWGETAVWSWDSSVGRTGSTSLSIANSRWNVGWAGRGFPIDGSYVSVYPCYAASAWVRGDLTTGRTYLSVGWYGSSGWICNTNTRYARTSDNGKWIEFSVMAMPSAEAYLGLGPSLPAAIPAGWLAMWIVG